MLQRDRHIQTQVRQLGDAALFALSFWLAFSVRGSQWFTNGFGLDPIGPDAF